VARPWYLNEKGVVALLPEDWKKVKGDGSAENPVTVKGEKITGSMILNGQRVNLINGVEVKQSKQKTSVSLDTTEIPSETPEGTDTGNKDSKVDVRTKYGIGEALINHPIYGAEIKKIFALLDAGKLAEAEEEYFKSAWGKLDSDAQNRILMQLENDKLYKEKLKNWMVTIKRQLASRGLKADDKTLEKYYLDGIDDETIFDELAGGISAKGAAGEIGNALESLRSVARANGFNLEKDFGLQVDGWLQRISKGESLDDFTRLIRQQAKLGLPEKVGALLDEGLDLVNIYAPYRTRMANLLELTPDAISLDDPLLRSAYGQDKEMSLYDFQRAVRKDPRWQYTDNAREEVSNAALSVLRDFGFQG